MRLGSALGVTFLSPLLVLAQSKEAHACGGCFHPPSDSVTMSTVVTGHRMAFATSGTRTVLWDQIRYSGNPTEFSWVLPIKGNVKLEQSTDAWFEALDTVTNGRVSPPQLNCFNRTGGGSGCSCGGASSDSAPASFSPRGSGGPISGGGVIVTHEGSIGPYAYVQVMGGGQALADWLPMNGYAVPKDIEPVLAAYAQEGFGFIALRLQPGQQIKQMTPVRVITEGGVATLPLRMVAAGTGDFVAITLYVIAEGRYEVDGFGAASIDASKLSWDWANSQSNYADVRNQALTAESGKVWLTGFSQLKGFTKTHVDALNQPIVFSINPGSGSGSGGPIGPSPMTLTNLTDLYFAQAESNATQNDTCSTAGISGKLGTSSMVYDDCKGVSTDVDGGAPPASGTCPAPPAGTVAASSLVCKGYSDIAAAMIGMHPDTVWLTRLEANLPRAWLAADLKIKPSNPQDPVSNAFRAAIHVNPPCDLLENHPEVTLLHRRSQEAGIGLLSGVGLFFARRLRRRRSGERPVGFAAGRRDQPLK